MSIKLLFSVGPKICGALGKTIKRDLLIIPVFFFWHFFLQNIHL